MFDSHGIPLDIIVDRFNEHGLIVDWLDFWDDAMKQGWKPDRTLSKLRAVVGDVYGPVWASEWERRLLHCLKAREDPDGPQGRNGDEEDERRPAEPPRGPEQGGDASE